jgi:hypothetical protein
MRVCYLCGEGFMEGQLVELTVIAHWVPLKSKVAYSISKPVDAYADTLRHHTCPQNDAS